MALVSDDGKIFATEFERAVDDLVANYPGFKPYKGFRESPNFEDRREEETPKPQELITQDIIDQTQGKFINPNLAVPDQLPRDLGVNILNDMIIKKESERPVTRDDIGDLLKDLKKKHPEHFPEK